MTKFGHVSVGRFVAALFRIAFMSGLFGFFSLAQALNVTDTFNTSGSQVWTAPAGVTSVTVEVWGGGGAGGGATSNPGKGGGGAGGQYASKVIAVTPLSNYTIVVGAGGYSGTGNGPVGGDSSFAATLVVAKGGAGGTGASNGVAGVGSATDGIGDTVYAGGSGSNASSTGTGGAGGGGAGSGGAGGGASALVAGSGTANGGGSGGSGLSSGSNGYAGNSAGGGGGGGYATGKTDRYGGDGGDGLVKISYVAVPAVSSINRSSFNPTSANKSVVWVVTFSQSVTGVDTADFTLLQTGGATGASITSVAGSGTSWTVTANTGTSNSGNVGLNLTDNDSITASGVPLGGTGAGNGNFTGQSYTLLPSVCTGASDIVFCDDFERSNPGSVGNGWTVTPASASNCSGGTGNTGCAGIDSDIPPFDDSTNPRANPTRSLFTRWNTVSVDSKVISLAGKAGVQLSFWMRRGGDAFSEYPEASGENYLVQYLASDSTWKILAQYPSGVMEGQVFNPVIELPADALHAGFKMRFYQPSGSGKSGSGGASGVVGYDYWHMDDVVIREVSAPRYVGAFCENFEAGLGRWSVTAEGAPASANIGDASIGSLAYQSSNHELDMRWGYVTAATFKTDLTGVGGNITYWIRSGTTSARDPVTNENLVVEYLNSAGSWTALVTYPGSVAAGTVYTPSFVLPADAKHANFRLRFRQIAGSGYDKSYWHVDDVCVGDPLPTADLALSMSGGTLVPGSSASYTLKVTNNGPGTLAGSLEIVDTLPSGLSYLAGSGTGWVCGANGQVVTCNWTGTLASGAVAPDLLLTVAVGAGVSGSVTNTATVSGTVNDNVPGNNTASYTSGNFVPAYVFTDKPCLNGIAIGTGATPCYLLTWSSQAAGQSKAGIYITAVNSSGVPTQLSASSATTVGFQFGLTCHDPIANAGVQSTFSAAGSALPLCTGSGAEPAAWSTAVNLSFAAASPSVASSYTFSYADVGEVELFMRNAVSTAQKGSSGKFVLKPAGFILTEIKPTANPTGRCAVATTSVPAVACASAAADAATFVRASEAFSATVKAVTAGGVAAPNFGKEKVSESVRLNPNNVIAGMVSPPDVAGGFNAFNAGIATGTGFSWDEVGIITLTPKIKDGDYLGAGDVTGTETGNVGRFIPDHFFVEPGGVINRSASACAIASSFTYFGETLQVKDFRLTARNGLAMPTATKNYTGSFAKFDGGVVANFGFGAVDLADSIPPITATAVAIGGGAGEFVLSSSGSWATGTEAGRGTFSVNVTLNRSTTLPMGPYESFRLGVAPVDTDGVTVRADDKNLDISTPADAVNDNVLVGSSRIRFGRLRLSNSFGSEKLLLAVPLQAQYWAGSYFVNNTDDSCTSVSVPPALTLAGSATPAGSAQLYFYPVVTGKNELLPQTPTLNSLASGALNAGKINLQFPKPDKRGWLDIVLNVPDYLKYNWGNCNGQSGVPGLLDDLPCARATFGIFGAQSPIIYRRENY